MILIISCFIVLYLLVIELPRAIKEDRRAQKLWEENKIREKEKLEEVGVDVVDRISGKIQEEVSLGFAKTLESFDVSFEKLQKIIVEDFQSLDACLRDFQKTIEKDLSGSVVLSVKAELESFSDDLRGLIGQMSEFLVEMRELWGEKQVPLDFSDTKANSSGKR